MSFKKVSLVSLVGATLLLAAYCPKPATSTDKEKVLLQTFIGTLTQLHFVPQQMTDEFSKKVYDLYLDRLDSGRRFLTKEDIIQLAVFNTQIDNQIQAGSLEIFETSMRLLDAGIAKAEVAYQDAIKSKMDFTKTENVQFGDNLPFPANDAELRDNWRKSIKYEIMTRLASKLDSKEKGNVDMKDKTVEMLEKEATDETAKTYDRYFKRLKTTKRSDRLSLYMNSISNVYDPHTEYFEPAEKQNFDITMSGRLIGIGARLQTDLDAGFTKVTDIVMGGPAWKQKELQEGDLILKVAQGAADPVDVMNMDINDVVAMIRGKEKTEVRLTVKKKADGSTKIISIIREEVIMDEGFAKSIVINSESNERIGYILLPRFYADFEKRDGHQCAEDVEAEIEKLKAANVKGIILDLRNNGGGSLADVVKMSGLLIEQGPMVQVKGRDSRPEVLDDDDPAVQYDGAFIVMVNEFSASASEIMAAALQDYGRAVIVGSNTYGKGTVQRFFNLDNVARDPAVKPLGSVKVTTQKFYRINGSTTQLQGVKPDILLPDNYTEVNVGERDQEHPLPSTQIAAVKYSQRVQNVQPFLTTLAAKSEKRTSANNVFKQIALHAKDVKKQKDERNFSLNLQQFRAYEQKLKEKNKQYSELFKPMDALNTESLNGYVEAMGSDTSKINRHKEWLKDVKKDVQLYETLNIMHDLLGLTQGLRAGAETKDK
jgi:carboxyl-terminal processing protease